VSVPQLTLVADGRPPDPAIPRAVRPSIAPTVRQYIAEEIRLAGGKVELCFGCAWDASTKTITSAELLWRGMASEAPCVSSDVTGGRVFLHNHPSGRVEPSADDLAAANGFAHLAIGFGIISNDATELFMVREPLEPYLWRDRAANPPAQRRIRSWKLWRFSLWYEAPPE
jgi:hypothetical protein